MIFNGKVKYTILKIMGSILFFWAFKGILQVIFGNYLEFFLSNYWLFVLAGLVPAYLAKLQGYSFLFFPIWLVGTLYPIIITITVVCFIVSREKEKN